MTGDLIYRRSVELKGKVEDRDSVQTQDATSTADGSDDDLREQRQPNIESQDIPLQRSFFATLLESMSPRRCLEPAHDAVTSCHLPGISAEPNIEEVAHPLIKELKHVGKDRHHALQKLYRLTDKNRRYNRTPLVRSKRFDIVGTLTQQCLGCDQKTGCGVRRQALLILNNLCIPMANKDMILFGENSEILLTSLLKIIRKRLPESYLAVVVLVTLSAYDDAKSMLFSYVPSNTDADEEEDAASNYKYHLPVDDKKSLLRTIEKCMKEFYPYLSGAADVHSVEQEFIRWSMNLFRSLISTSRQNAAIVANKTEIATMAAEVLRKTRRDVSLWTRESLEDASLMILVHCAKDDENMQVLNLIPNLKKTLFNMEVIGGIHETRARALHKRLKEYEESIGIFDDESDLLDN